MNILPVLISVIGRDYPQLNAGYTWWTVLVLEEEQETRTNGVIFV